MSTQEITCQGITFPVPTVYEEGQVLTANEAAALDQLRRENIRNNFASNVKAACKEAGVETSAELPEEIQVKLLEDFEKYTVEYAFGVRTGGVGRVMDPIERLMHARGVEAVKASLRAKGFKLTGKNADITREDFNSVVAAFIKKNEVALRAAAVAAHEAFSKITVEELTAE